MGQKSSKSVSYQPLQENKFAAREAATNPADAQPAKQLNQTHPSTNSLWNNPDPIRYMNGQTINRPVAKIETRLIPSEEGTPDDTLYQHLSAEGIPVFYYLRKNALFLFDPGC